ncbi:MAG: hypothetical protein JRN67_13820, partial [Nitrososphaerota archaeon]|nr:hypothetical protein [Nitrososphaerota archaeon]
WNAFEFSFLGSDFHTRGSGARGCQASQRFAAGFFHETMKDFRCVYQNAREVDICVRIGINLKASIRSHGRKSQDNFRARIAWNILCCFSSSRDGKAEKNQQIESLRTFAHAFLE